MRYRKLSLTGDMQFGSGLKNFLINSPETVAQAVVTTLKLWLGEWYLNLNDGTPYPEGVIGKHSQATADQTLISQIQGVQGVRSLTNWVSTIDPNTRTYTSVGATLDTIYGQTQLQIDFSEDF